MGKSVRAIEEEFTHNEILEWMVYNKLEPFGEFRADMRSAHICATLANINRGKNRKAFTIKDFMLFKEFPTSLTKKQTTEQMKEILMSMLPPEQRKQKECQLK